MIRLGTRDHGREPGGLAVRAGEDVRPYDEGAAIIGPDTGGWTSAGNHRRRKIPECTRPVSGQTAGRMLTDARADGHTRRSVFLQELACRPSSRRPVDAVTDICAEIA